MIIVEERLAEAFAQLPEIQGFKPQYESGNDKHLNKYMNLMAKDKKCPYPLIYQISNTDNQDEMMDNTVTDLVLILACQNLQTELLNHNRYAMSYRNILNPLLENITKVFYRAGIFNWDGRYRVEKFPNFGDAPEEKNKTTDIWDAIRLTTTITVNSNCIVKNIKF